MVTEVRSKQPSEVYLDQLTWEEKARSNPLYGVMSVNDFVHAGSEPTVEQLGQFFAEGEAKVGRWIAPWLRSLETAPDSAILEYGCGMGRLVRTVHVSYPHVTGVDISATMVGHATRYVQGAEFKVLSAGGDIPLQSATIDRAYSYAVFQHIDRWSVVCKALSEIARVLKSDGHAKLQFDMVFPPGYGHGELLGRHTYAFERSSIVYGWTRRLGLPLPGVKRLRHGHWRGARPGYGQLVSQLRRYSLQVYGLEHVLEAPHLVWVLVRKTGG